MDSQEVQEAINGHETHDADKQWFVMRDLTRPNAKLPAYKMLEKMKIDFFTPMVHKLVMVKGKREDREVPFIHDLISCTMPKRSSTLSWKACIRSNTVS